MAFLLDLETRYPSQKLAIFLWQLCHNSLSVRHTLHQRHIIPFNTCPLCTTKSETIDHCFLRCPSIRRLWSLTPHQSWVSFSPSHNNLLLTLNSLKCKKDIVTKHIFLLWHIWKERNDMFFNQGTLNLYRIVHKAKFLYTEWSLRSCADCALSSGKPLPSPFTLIHPSQSSGSPPLLVAWEPPPPTTLLQAQFRWFGPLLRGSRRHHHQRPPREHNPSSRLQPGDFLSPYCRSHNPSVGPPPSTSAQPHQNPNRRQKSFGR